jgi:hypothetical protein
VTIEIDDIRMTPGPDLESLWNWNYRSLLRYLGEVLYGIHGVVTDADNGNPVGARIFITGHDSDSSHVYSDTLTGRFCRLLATGTYNFTVTAKGYIPYSFDATVTSYDHYESREIILQPEKAVIYPDPPDSGLLIYPDPSPGLFWILTPKAVTGDIIVNLITLTGVVIRSFRAAALPGVPVRCDVPGLPEGVYVVSVRRLPYGPLVRGKVLISRFISR